uniref:Uncharacterized protein n=2 Tax=Lotharella globosa TaxID=91324 RepID=A0A7S4DHC2_9EUKA
MAEKHYSAFAPYQFLAYWFELWTGYEGRRGSTSTRWAVRGDQKESTALFDVSKPKAPRTKRRRKSQTEMSSRRTNFDSKDDNGSESRCASRDLESTDSSVVSAVHSITPTKKAMRSQRKRSAREFEGK